MGYNAELTEFPSAVHSNIYFRARGIMPLSHILNAVTDPALRESCAALHAFVTDMIPGMDGYEATRAIRSLGISTAKTIPIIAMTANVFKGGTDKCLEAGMNDHVGKPLGFDEVLGQLRRYLP